MTIVVALAAALISGAATWLAAVRVAPGMPLRRANYRGVRVPTALGVAQLFGLLSGIAFVALVSEISPVLVPPGLWVLPVAAAVGFGLLGLLDDAMSTLAPGEERGLGAHASALLRGRLTSGGIKLVGGIALAFALAAPATDGFGFALLGALVIALSANVVNGFDVRPGRAAKAFLVGAIPLAVVAGPLRATVCAGIGASLGFLRMDLRERAMGGDCAANAFGAFLGCGAVLLSTRGTLLIVAGVLAVLQILAESPGFSRLIAAVPPLRAADAWGRVHETPNDDDAGVRD